MALGWIKITTLATVLVWISVAGARGETARYDVDPDHSTIGFSVDHMVVSKTRGQFTEYIGFIEMDLDAKTVKAIEATIKTPSITTNHQKRDTHLKSPDFFDVEQYPTMIYKMKSYRKTGDGYTAIGDLTLHGITKEITLVGNFNGVNKDPWGNTRVGFAAEGKINRKDFGINWNKALDNGGVIVGNEVFIKLDVECIKVK
jgi:polyisoprenoid-binding protein YceI